MMDYKSLSDEELMALFRESAETRAFDELQDRYGGRLFALICRAVRDREIANDLLQETWIRATSHASSFDETRRFGPWVRTIAIRLVFDYLRRKRRRPEVLESDDPAGVEKPSALDQVYSREQPPDAELLSAEFHLQMWDCVGRLPERQGVAFIMTEIEGLTGSDVAEALDCSESAAYVLLCRAKKNLRTCLQSKGYYVVHPDKIPAGAWTVFFFEVPTTKKRPGMNLVLIWLFPDDRDGIEGVDY